MSRHNPQPAIERLRLRVDIDPDTGCHNYRGCTDAEGYGQISIDGKRRAATHRVAYEAAFGPIPTGLVIDHKCRNTRCCNPAHLEAVTQQENMRRGSFGRRTHCKHGHEYTPENTYSLPRGRQCRECRRLKVAARRTPAEGKETRDNLNYTQPSDATELVRRAQNCQHTCRDSEPSWIIGQLLAALQASQARATAAEGDETFRNAIGWQDRATRAEALLGEAVKVLKSYAEARNGYTAASFLSSLSHQDEQG